MPKKPAETEKQNVPNETQTGDSTFFPPDFYPDPQHHDAWDKALRIKHDHPELFAIITGVSTAEITLAKKYSKVAGHSKWCAQVLIASLENGYGLARPATGPGIVDAICEANRADDLTAAGVALMEEMAKRDAGGLVASGLPGAVVPVRRDAAATRNPKGAGRKPATPEELRRDKKIYEDRLAGKSYKGIADGLNEDNEDNKGKEVTVDDVKCWRERHRKRLSHRNK